MPTLTLIVVPLIVAVFAAFMLIVGGAALWCALPDRRSGKADSAKATRATERAVRA